MNRHANPHAATLDGHSHELPADVRWSHVTASVLFLLAAVMAVAMALIWAVRQPAFDLTRIAVEGEVSRNSASTLGAYALPLIEGNYFTLNMAQAQRAFESVPWVRRAALSRVWPSQLRVQLEEHHPVALWAYVEGSDQLVNSFGEVFQANVGDVEDDDLPNLQGPEGSAPQVLKTFVRLRPVFDRLKLRLQALTLTGQGSWQAQFHTGARIELGRGSELELQQRAERFIGTVQQVISHYERPLVYADLRHNDGYALRLKGITTVVPGAAGLLRN